MVFDVALVGSDIILPEVMDRSVGTVISPMTFHPVFSSFEWKKVGSRPSGGV
jgi:hypothetical protein